MLFDPTIALAGLLVGSVVGLTGMGGGALMTPVLILVFGIPPLAAVSSDLVTSLLMKPFGGAVHLIRGTVRRDIAGWLMLGAVPSAFLGVLLLRFLGADNVEGFLQRAIGVALLVAAASILVRSRMQAGREAVAGPGARATVRPLRTLAIGVVGGLLVGLTSVGSGSVIIVLLMLAYPALTSSELVGTDIVQAVPLVGAHYSSRSSSRLVRPALFAVLLTTGLKLVQVA